MTMFAKRHYEWLAAWAGEHLNEGARYELAYALQDENSMFDFNKFIRACEKADEAHCLQRARFITARDGIKL